MSNGFSDAEDASSTVVACRDDMKFPFISLHLL